MEIFYKYISHEVYIIITYKIFFFQFDPKLAKKELNSPDMNNFDVEALKKALVRDRLGKPKNFLA